ncbi:MAG: hypothetical protein ACYC6X_02105 [Minisyncoccota bacterium]
MNSSFSTAVIASFACIGLMVGYGVWYAHVENRSLAVANLENQISTQTTAESRIVLTRASLAEVAGDEAVLQSYFVSETGVVSFIDSLEAQGKVLSATVNVLSVSANSAQTEPTIKLALTIKGTFDAVMRTIGAIEYAPYDLSISTLSVTQDAKNSWRANLNLVVGSVPAGTATSTP